MEQTKYIVTQTVGRTEEAVEYSAYGLEHTETGVALRDITTRKEKAERLAALFSRRGVSPTHMRDIVEDIMDDIICWNT